MKKLHFLLTLLILLPFGTFSQTTVTKVVYFATNSADLDKSARQRLDSILPLFAGETDFTITLKGHTDDIGSNELNDQLSEARVASVKAYFVSRGVPSGRISGSAFGENTPAVQNTSAANKARNRRVEIVVGIEPILEVVEEPKQAEDDGWPPVDGIVVHYGTDLYDIPQTWPVQKVEVSVLTNTNEMENENFTTMTTRNEALSSNLIICVRRPPGVTNCDLDKPLKIYIPVSANPFCNAGNVKFYDAEKDSTGEGRIKWKEIDPGFSIEVHDGKEYFVIYAANLCIPCKNFDCPKLYTDKQSLKLKSRRFTVTQADIIHLDANALLPGEELERNHWKLRMLNQNNYEPPTVKVTVKKRAKTVAFKLKLSELETDKNGVYIITRKELRKQRKLAATP